MPCFKLEVQHAIWTCVLRGRSHGDAGGKHAERERSQLPVTHCTLHSVNALSMTSTNDNHSGGVLAREATDAVQSLSGSVAFFHAVDTLALTPPNRLQTPHHVTAPLQTRHPHHNNS